MKKARIAIIPALLLLLSGAAFAQEANTAVTRLAWIDAEGAALDEAHIGDTVTAFAAVNTAHIPDGTEVSLIIFEYNEDEGQPDDYVAQLNATVQDGAIRAAWEVAYDKEQTNTQCARETADKGWTIPRYRFGIRYVIDGETYRSAFSSPLTAWGWAHKRLLDKDTHVPVANCHYTLYVSDGTERKGVTDGKGLMEFEGHLPVGELSISIGPLNEDDDEDIDDGDAIFLLLCIDGTAEQIHAAIDAGADVNKRDMDGWTPLTIAAGFNYDADAVRVLLDAGADVNTGADGGLLPLMWAAGHNNTAAAQVLLDAGADVNAADNGGWTPLMFAASADCEDMVQLLLDAGADIRARNNDGKSAIDIVADNGMDDTITWLLLAEAAGMSAGD
jgi:hypothetical protein